MVWRHQRVLFGHRAGEHGIEHGAARRAGNERGRPAQHLGKEAPRIGEDEMPIVAARRLGIQAKRLFGCLGVEGRLAFGRQTGVPQHVRPDDEALWLEVV